MRILTKPRFLLLLACWAVALPSIAQIPGINPKPVAPAAAATSIETPEQTAKRLQQWLKETRLAISQLNDPAQKAPPGIDAAAISDYRRDLEQIVLGIGRHQKILATMPDADKSLTAAQTEEAEWTGFSQPPPYSILMLDELFNQLSAAKAKAASYRSSLNLFDQTLSNIHEEAKLAAETSRRLRASAIDNPNHNGSALKWKITADQAKSRSLALRSTIFQSNVALVEIQAETVKSQLALLERQITTAQNDVSFGTEELEKINKASDDRRASLRKEMAAVRKRQQETTAERTKLQAELDGLLAAESQNGEVEISPDPIVLARFRLEASEARLEASQFIIEILESIDLLETYIPEAYNSRWILKTSTDKPSRSPARALLNTFNERLRAWDVVVANHLAAINADISKQESRASLIPPEDPLSVAINDQRSALWDKQAVTQRLGQQVAAQRRGVKRWLAELDLPPDEQQLAETLSEATSSVWDSLKKIWDFEIFRYTDTVIISGIPSSQVKAVPLGKFILAILFFLTAYFIASRVRTRVQAAVVRRGHIAEAQARTLGNWLMIVVSSLLAVATLHYLRIPLTVFAFFGGALAIGLGFGSQTLIKNFISGIIVLFERKIRVGDVVDVGGIAGSVTEINTRSSVVCGPDGRETLVPNSVFLETSVTNLTLASRVLRRFVNVGVAYGTPPAKVIEILTTCAERHGLVRKDPGPLIMLSDFGDNAMVFKFYFWIALDGKTNGEMVESDLRIMIEKAFTEAGVVFPFPQRDIRLSTETPLMIATYPPEN